MLISFRGVSFGVNARVVGLGFSGGFDAVYSKTQNKLMIFASGDVSVSPLASFRSGKGLKFKGDWSIGPIWNLGSPRNFRGFGASANWPAPTFGLLCRAGALKRGPIWGYACHSRKLSKAGLGFTIGFGFSGFNDSSISFMKFSRGTSISSDLIGWAAPIETGPIVDFLKPIVESISSSSTADTAVNTINSLETGN